MNTKDFLIGAGVGALGVYLWFWNKNKNKDKKSLSVTETVITEEANKYPTPLLKEYDIVMPSDQISAKLAQKAQKFTNGRYAVNRSAIKPAVKI